MAPLFNQQQKSIKVSEEAASITDLADTLAVILPALEKFQQFHDVPDPTIVNLAQCRDYLNEPLPHRGSGAQVVLDVLRNVVIPNGARSGAPGFSGWITTAPTTIPAVAQLAASIAGPQREWNHAFNLLENLALQWLVELVGLPAKDYQGMFTSGGAIANLLCFIVARQAAYEKRGIDPAQVGLAGVLKPRLYASDQITGVLHRDVAIMGFGREALVTIPATKEFKLNVTALRQRLQIDIAAGCTPVAIIANAGTTSTGSIDPLEELADLCQEKNIWLHIDGAYGLLGILDPRVASLYKGLGYADSWVVDPHKWLAVPVGCGAAFVRDKTLLQRAFALGPAPFLEAPHPPEDIEITSPYDTWGYAFGDLGMESSSPARGTQVWAILKEIGVEGVRVRIQRHNTWARDLAKLVEESESLQLMAPVTLSICCYRYIPPEWREHADEAVKQLNDLNRLVLKRVRARGCYAPSYTTINGAFVLRSCFINPRMTNEVIEGLVEEVKACGDEIWSEQRA